jgi:tetratricopeptide (TPR) repeat protein
VPPKPPEPWAERPEVESIREMLLAGTLTALTTDGRGGQGKTALAQKIAWDEAVRAHFTNGVLWVRLGKNPDVMGELAQLAANFGVDVSSHATIEARKDAVRSLLFGRRCLLIIDDAWTADAAQVFWDVASGPVLLTTRVRSIAHEVAPGSLMTLGQLLPDEATKLLKRLAPNVADSPELPRIVALADGLPLTLRLLAPIVARHADVGLGLKRILDDIESPSWRGDRLAAIVAKSLDDLSEAEQTAFAQLAVFGARPADFDLRAVAAVWNFSEDLAYSRLTTLVDRNLVDVEGKRRFSLHQSIADTAAARLPADDPAPARYATYYLALVNQDREDWRAIYAELMQIQRAWELISDNATILEFVQAMGVFMKRYGLGQETIRWAERGMVAAQALGQQADEATLLNNIGAIYADLGERQRALEYLKQALQLRDLVDDLPGKATTLTNIAGIYANLFGEGKRALEYYEQALPVQEAVGDAAGQAATLTGIGGVYARLGEWRRALKYLKQALPLREVVGDRAGQATTLNNIGFVYANLGEGRRALEYYEQALPLRKAVGDRAGQAATLLGIGYVYANLGEEWRSLEYLKQALPLQVAVGDRLGQAATLTNMGGIYANIGEVQRALEFYEQALPLQETVGDRAGKAMTLTGIGFVYSSLGERQRALEFYDQALRLQEVVGDRAGQAATLTNIGGVYTNLGEGQRALEYLKQALPLQVAIGDRRGQRYTLFNMAMRYHEAGTFKETERLLTQVVALDAAIEHPSLERDQAILLQVRAMLEEQAKGNPE